MDIFDIARLAGVSRKTVQRVLNGAPNVSAQTRDKVRKIMEEHHYEPNAAARRLSARKTNTIGIFIVQDERNYKLYSDDLFYGAVIGSMISRCAEHGYNALVSIHDISNTDSLISLYKQKSIDAGMLVGWFDLQAVVDRIAGAGFHVGVFDQNTIRPGNDGIPVPILDNYRSAYEAAQYLLDMGHRDLGIVTGDMNNRSAAERLHGFADALRKRGIDLPESRIYYGKYTEEDGAAAAERWIAANELPQALFCSNDLTAYGVLKTLARHGVAVPRQVSVIGFDDLLVSQYMHPPLTTMRVPRVEMAVYITDAMIDRIENRETARSSPQFTAELVVRDSCCGR
ncbi:HTH-type transcriptional regulator AscG [Paenibacillus sp. CECT 9249]|uniref:LacI family DNA-binding transcriptional regulator n=1 Tax=Paenibacillus sp. CECT 9249 TaxID=2845385 RepID=UPI001E4693B8|nr:LacI family DNA-binding transcriptional regulator [Paenibacillus sp. CECT 9249]CAH0119227.1 HTH-type transcriptional regulator AscG [Paenibacillus sp. CECT 9249]